MNYAITPFELTAFFIRRLANPSKHCKKYRRPSGRKSQFLFGFSLLAYLAIFMASKMHRDTQGVRILTKDKREFLWIVIFLEKYFRHSF